MSHPQQVEFCKSTREKYPNYFENVFVLDIGSLDINGNNQALFSNVNYLGLDVAAGNNVDIVSKGHELSLPDATFDTIISTECFEHDMHYKKTLGNIVRLLKPGGFFIFTCATTGRPEHGTRRTTPHDAPLLLEFSEWIDYYKNLTEEDIREVLNVDEVFSEYEFSVNEESKDLYFWGVKKGVLNARDNYSFMNESSDNARLQGNLTFANNELALNEKKISLLEEKVSVLKNDNKALLTQQNELATQVGSVNSELACVYNSISWKLTKPLRLANLRFKHLAKKLIIKGKEVVFSHPKTKSIVLKVVSRFPRLEHKLKAVTNTVPNIEGGFAPKSFETLPSIQSIRLVSKSLDSKVSNNVEIL